MEYLGGGSALDLVSSDSSSEWLALEACLLVAQEPLPCTVGLVGFLRQPIKVLYVNRNC